MKRYLWGLVFLAMTGCGQSIENSLVVDSNEIDVKPGLIENNLGGLDLSSVTQVQNKLEDGWVTYVDEKNNFEFSYPKNWQSSLKNENDSVKLIAEGVPANPLDYTPGWSNGMSNEEIEAKTYGFITISTSVTKNELGLETVDLWQKIVDEGLDPAQVFANPCFMNMNKPEIMENNLIMIGGVGAFKRPMGVCPPGGGAAEIVMIATKDHIYQLSMSYSPVGQDRSGEEAWKKIFEKIYLTFKLV